MPESFWKEAPQNMSGLEIIQAVIEGNLPQPPISLHMNMKLVAAEFGQAVFEGVPIAETLNPAGTVHGGWYGTILDSAMGCAVHTVVPSGKAIRHWNIR